MALFRVLDGERAQQLRAAPLRNEKQVQTLIERNLDAIFGVRFVATEFSTGQRQRGRIDTLGLDQDGSPVILEYKRVSNENIINQGLFYLDWLMDHRGDFEVAARGVIKPDEEVSWSSPRLILIAESFGSYDLYAVNRIDDRIELWKFRLYESGLLNVERFDKDELTTREVKPRGGGTVTTTAATKRRRGVGFDLQHHTGKMSDTTQALFETLRDQITALGDDVTERFMKQYVGYRRLKNFVEIVGQKRKLVLYIDGPVDDPEGLTQDFSGKGHWGTGNQRVWVTSDDDIDRVMPLIKQAYELQR